MSPDPPDPPEVWVIYFFHNQRGKNRYRQGQRNHCFIQRGRGGHAAMNPAISCSNPGSSQNPVRTPQKPAPTPRKPVPTPPKTALVQTFFLNCIDLINTK